MRGDLLIESGRTILSAITIAPASTGCSLSFRSFTPSACLPRVRGLVYEAFVIPTSSMSPTILEGDRILARKLLPQHHFPERGDLIVYRNPMPTGATNFIGRVVARGRRPRRDQRRARDHQWQCVGARSRS